MRKTLLFIVFVFSALGTMYSQSGFTLSTGVALPVGKFADDSDDEYAAGAGVGFSLGGKYSVPIGTSGLHWHIGADFNYNGLKKSVKDDLETQFDNMGYDVSITYTKYINVPVITGLSYFAKVDDGFSLFFEGGVGLDYLKATTMTVTSGYEKVEFIFDPSTQFAFRIGGGLLFSQRYYLSFNYSGLGKHSLKTKLKENGNTILSDNTKLDVSMICLTLGIKL